MDVKKEDHMEKVPLTVLKSSLPAVARLATFSKDAKLWIDHDKTADVLYISFGRPREADEAIHGADDMIWRKQGNTLIGVTILRASRFLRVS